MYQQVEIEEAFNAVAKKCNGQLVSDIVGQSPGFVNADYVFHHDKVVAELKCLEEDKSNDPATKQRLGNLWVKWREGGLVSGPVPPAINSRTLPPLCQNEMCRVMGEPIKRCIQKANAQIRATKSALNLSDYRGLLLLANDGNLIFEMPVMIHLIYLTIKDHFHEIDNVVFFSGNMVSFVAKVGRPARFWIGLHRDDAEPMNQLTDRLSREWMARYDSISGARIYCKSH
ncbi:MAG: hypothetical protein LV481_11125 [Methylacidiphilales bacterium]|nr:hypothetical protein [Candidatus Methylacidiphilales bacterium]